MEDMISALLDVVRAQHSATEGTDEAPFDMDDIVDMAMNILGRPEDKAEENEMVDSIQKMVESMAPDIFPPKTFEQMDDSEKVLSAANMIENRFKTMNASNASSNNPANTNAYTSASAMESYSSQEPEEEEETQDAGELNDLIYKNFMQMMGLNTPQVEYPFDRSQIVYGKEKSITEQLAEEEEEKKRAASEEASKKRKLSAWELAQNAIDDDEAAHMKEEYVPEPIEEPTTKSASQMAAEAIRQSEERDRMQSEIEKQAEALMEEARKRGQDPMKFMLHQQEILQYMEKNSDELVSFEDYEDLTPEEKMEIERQIHIEKQIADGVDPDQVDKNVPEEYIPDELKGQPQSDTAQDANAAPSAGGTEEAFSTFDEDILRALSQQVLSENSDMILSENADEDINSLQEELFQNLKRMMAGSGTPVPQENVASLLSQAAANQMAAYEDDTEESDSPETTEEQAAPSEISAASAEVSGGGKMSAVELAKKRLEMEPKPKQEERNTVSAVELAKAAQKASKPEKKEETSAEPEAEQEEELDLSFDELDDMFDEPSAEQEESKAETPETATEEAASSPEPEISEDKAEKNSEESLAEPVDQEPEAEMEVAEDGEYEYVDPDELVLGDHTQAEIDEALDNLGSLGLEGEVYERAKRMILLELAGSEPVLEAYLMEQENNKKKKKANVSALDEDNLDDLSDFDEDLFEKELEMAMDEDFEEEVSEDVETDGDPESDTDGEVDEEIDEEIDEIIDDESGESQQNDAGEPVKEESDEEAEEVEVIDTPPVEDRVETVPEEPEEKTEINNKKSKSHRNVKTRKNVVHKKDRTSQKKADRFADNPADKTNEKKSEDAQNSKEAEEKGYQVSVRKPFVLKNSTSFMDKFEDFITENQENRRLSTGFKKLDGLLRFGLHKGSYFIDAHPQYLKNAFMQQIADRAAEDGVDVLYISTELSRYDLMVDSISRLSYEMNGFDSEKAHSVMSIMTGEKGATLDCLADQLNWYRGRISEHLFILDQEAVDEFVDSMEEEVSAGAILEELIRSIVTEGAHKPVVFIDNIENILSVEDSEDMKPLMDGIRQLAKELSIPIIMSYGYAQAENEEDLSLEEQEFHESIGNMCDVYLELQYADMITEDSVELTQEDIREMMEDGDSLLIDVMIYRNRRPMRASCQIQGTPKYNFFEE